MSTRRERANRWWLRCPKCGAWKARHFEPWTKTYTCQPLDDDAQARADEAQRAWREWLECGGHPG